MRTLTFFLLLLSFQNNISAQIIIKGIVFDTLSNPLPMVNIIAVPTQTTNEVQFCITDKEGKYKFVLDSKSDYKISANYLGYKQHTFYVTKNTETVIHDIYLKIATNKLNEIIVNANQPIVIKEDTISYNADYYKIGDERKLKDILIKLPGIEVNENLNITVNGKKVNTLLVEGKPFFSGDTKLAIENIPSEAIDKIEIIDNYNSVSFLKKFNESNKLAMNIKLKKKKQKFAFGDIEAGTNTDKYYLAHTNLFYYTPNNNLNFIGDFNNSGKQFFTFKDYITFDKSLNSFLTGSGSDYDFTENDLSSLMEKQDFISNNNQFIATNIYHRINKKIDISGYGIFSKALTGTLQKTNTHYLLYNNSYFENINAQSNNNNLMLLGKINTNYFISDSEKLILKINFKGTQTEYNSRQNTKIIDSVTNFLIFNELDAILIKSSLAWHKRISSKQALSIVINYKHTPQNKETVWHADNAIINNIFPTIKDSLYMINQNKLITYNKLSVFIKSSLILSNSGRLDISAGNLFKGNSYKTQEYQQLTNGSINNFTDNGFGNNMLFRLNDLFLGAHFIIKKGISSYKTGLYACYYIFSNKQNKNINKNKFVFLPDISLIKFNNSESLQLSYKLKTQYVSPVNYLNNYACP